MKRFIKALSIALVFILIGTAVLAATWEFYFPTIVKDTSGSARTYYPAQLDFRSQALIDQGYIDADALNTNMQVSSASIKYMMATDHVAAAIPNLPAGGQATADLYTDYAPPQTEFSIITGENGSFTMPDHASLEPVDNFEIEMDGYIKADVAGDFVSKQGAFEVVGDGTGDITASIFGSDNIISAPVTIVSLYSGQIIRVGQRYNNFPATTITQLSCYLWKTGAPGGDVTVQARRVAGDGVIGVFGTVVANTLGVGSAWYDFTDPVVNPVIQDIYFSVEFSGGGPGDQVKTYKTNVNSITGLYSQYIAGWVDDGALDYTLKLYWAVTAAEVTAVNVTDGDRNINVEADGANLTISIDGAVAGDWYDTVALGGASVPNNDSDWIIMGDANPYLNYYKHDVSSVQKAWFEPNTMVLDTSLLDSTADSGSNVTIVDAADLTQANDYWNGALVTILTTVDTNAPQGESSRVTDFDNGTNTLTFDALTAVVDPNDTYKVTFGTLVDRSGTGNHARLNYGYNEDITLSYGEMVSFDPTTATEEGVEGYEITSATLPATWFAYGENLTNLPLYPFINSVAIEIGMETQTIYFVILFGVALMVFLMIVMFTKSAFVGAFAMVIVLIVGSSMTIIPMWIPFSIIIVEVGIMFLYRQVSY